MQSRHFIPHISKGASSDWTLAADLLIRGWPSMAAIRNKEDYDAFQEESNRKETSGLEETPTDQTPGGRCLFADQVVNPGHG
jgi:hypothetical protein